MAQIPIPDFTQAGVHFGEASREIQEQFERINNIPTVQLQQIANQLTNLTHAIQRLNEAVER